MSKKPRRKFSEKSKKKAVEDYTSGKKSAVEVAHEMSVSVGLIYRWKADFEVNEGKSRVADLTASGMPRASALKMRHQEEEIAAYQKESCRTGNHDRPFKKTPRVADLSVRERIEWVDRCYKKIGSKTRA